MPAGVTSAPPDNMAGALAGGSTMLAQPAVTRNVTADAAMARVLNMGSSVEVVADRAAWVRCCSHRGRRHARAFYSAGVKKDGVLVVQGGRLPLPCASSAAPWSEPRGLVLRVRASGFGRSRPG